MPPRFGYGEPTRPEPVEFSLEDALLNTWVEDNSVYLKLDIDGVSPPEEPQPDQG